MSRPGNILVASCLLALAAGFLVGCAGRPPDGDMRPHPDFNGIGQKAVAQFDTNKDGVIAGAELDKCPGLKAALDRIDPNGTGKITAEMIAARVEAWDKSRIGRMAVHCAVTHNGKPLAGALVKFVPEKFLCDNYDGRRTATGETDKNGRAMVTIPVSGNQYDPPGVPPGFYRVEITKPGDKIPAKYNTDTILGQEVAIDVKGLDVAIGFTLEY